MKNVLVINNPNAGRKKAAKYKKLVIQFLLRKNCSFKTIEIDKLTSTDFENFDTIFITIIYLYFANIPKGTGYEVPASDANMNAMFGIITLLIYLLLLLPINFYMKIKGKINIKIYIIVNILSTIFGIIVFCMFSDEAKMIF